MREIPIYIDSNGKLIDTKKVFKITEKDSVCTVEWPNGVVDENVPLEMIAGEYAKIAEADVDKYFAVHSSEQAVEKLKNLVNTLSKSSTVTVTVDQINDWCKPPVKGGLKISQLRKKATELGVSSATSMKKAEIKAALLKLPVQL